MPRLKDLTSERFHHLQVLHRAPGKDGREALWECRCDCGNTTLATTSQLKKGLKRDCGCRMGWEGESGEDDVLGRRFGALTVIARPTTKRCLCRCDCGTTVEISLSDLLRGHDSSCGCKRYGPREEDISGRRFGRLTVEARADEKKRGVTLWRCKCDCGKETLVEGYRLRRGNTLSCGCKRSDRLRKDLTGQRFGKLVAEKRAGDKNGYGCLWLCRCDCGKTTKVPAKALLSGNTKSCGCGRGDAAKETLARHGTVADHNHFVDGTCVELLKRKKLNANNTSGYTGVQRRPNGKWAAILTFKGKVHYLGIYDRIEDAVAARKRGEEEYFEPFLERYRQDDT